MHSADGLDSEDIQELVRAARAGKSREFGQLVEAFQRPIYALAYRMMRNHADADDVAQETFIRAWSAIERYDPSYSFLGWLRTIATRLALNMIEKRRRRRTEGGEAFDLASEQHATTAPGPDTAVEGSEMQRALQAALGRLPDDYRLPLLLRTNEELSYAEIAKTLEIPVGTVMSRLHRARTLLRGELEAHGLGASPRRGHA